MVPDEHHLEEMQSEQTVDDLVSSAFSGTPDELIEVELKKQFHPWHLPRKHYCRLLQWCKNTQQLQKELKLSKPTHARPLRYLTLPGDELLDIRQLSEGCA